MSDIVEKDEMLPRQRVLAALFNKDFDRFPAICPTSVANLECMQISGCHFPKAHIDSQDMANLAATAHTVLGFDTVAPYFSVHLEAAALGCKVNWRDSGGMPVITKYTLLKLSDFVQPTNFISQFPCQQLIQAIRILKKRFGDKVAIIGKVIGPWSLAYNLYGAENLILDTILYEKQVHAFIEELLALPIALAKAQFEAGADIVTWADHVTADLISAEIYAEFILPLHKLASHRLSGYGPIILHTCGNVIDRIALFRQSGFRGFHIDSRNDISEAVKIAGNELILTGSVNNPITLTSGQRSHVSKEVLYNIQSGIRLISPECAVPFITPNSNLIELVNATHRAPLHLRACLQPKPSP